MMFTNLLHQPLWQQVFHKLHQVRLHNSIVEESHFSIDDTKNGRSLMGTHVVGQTALITNINHTDSNP